jgi:hypothetical protein
VLAPSEGRCKSADRCQRYPQGEMVDFSDRDSVRKWLDHIEPAERPREVAIALAARAALRVVPLLSAELTRVEPPRDIVLSDLVLPSLRASALSWAAAKYPAEAMSLTSLAGDAAHSAADATNTAKTRNAEVAAGAASSAAAAVVNSIEVSTAVAVVESLSQASPPRAPPRPALRRQTLLSSIPAALAQNSRDYPYGRLTI